MKPKIFLIKSWAVTEFSALVSLCFFQMLMSVGIRMVGVVTTAATQ